MDLHCTAYVTAWGKHCRLAVNKLLRKLLKDSIVKMNQPKIITLQQTPSFSVMKREKEEECVSSSTLEERGAATPIDPAVKLPMDTEVVNNG